MLFGTETRQGGERLAPPPMVWVCTLLLSTKKSVAKFSSNQHVCLVLKHLALRGLLRAMELSVGRLKKQSVGGGGGRIGVAALMHEKASSRPTMPQ